jgi:hypothetical protein
MPTILARLRRASIEWPVTCPPSAGLYRPEGTSQPRSEVKECNTTPEAEALRIYIFYFIIPFFYKKG